MNPSIPDTLGSDSSIPLPYPETPIFIMGYMASGKTTFARALAKATGREFIDLDFFIEQRFRKSISRIFAENGEDDFRKKEAAMLREAGEYYNVVIACGGGTPCFLSNLDYMKSRGLTVCLTASEDCIARRLLKNNARRPLMAGKSEEEIRCEITRGLQTRAPFYNAAHLQCRGEELENHKEIDASVRSFLAQFTSFADSQAHSGLGR